MPVPLLDFHVHDAPSAPGILALRNRYPGSHPPETGPFTLGLHPWRVNPAQLAKDLSAVAAGIRHPRCLAVGECGLDRCCATPWPEQQRAFSAQLALAVQEDRPLVLHAVKAWAEIIAARNAARTQRPWAIHAFRGKRELALDLVRHGFMLSFGVALIQAPTMREALAAVPADSFFLETDDAPGADLARLYHVAADLRGISVTELARRIFANFAIFAGHGLRQRQSAE